MVKAFIEKRDTKKFEVDLGIVSHETTVENKTKLDMLKLFRK